MKAIVLLSALFFVVFNWCNAQTIEGISDNITVRQSSTYYWSIDEDDNIKIYERFVENGSDRYIEYPSSLIYYIGIRQNVILHFEDTYWLIDNFSNSDLQAGRRKALKYLLIENAIPYFLTSKDYIKILSPNSVPYWEKEVEFRSNNIPNVTFGNKKYAIVERSSVNTLFLAPVINN